MSWQNTFFCKNKEETQSRCFKGVGPSSSSLYEQVKSNAKNDPSIYFLSTVALFKPRETPPSDEYMYEYAQFRATDFGQTKRIFFTSSGDAYDCSEKTCTFASAFSTNMVFERDATRIDALKFTKFEGFQDKCALVDYVVTRDTITKTVLFTAIPGIVC